MLIGEPGALATGVFYACLRRQALSKQIRLDLFARFLNNLPRFAHHGRGRFVHGPTSKETPSILDSSRRRPRSARRSGGRGRLFTARPRTTATRPPASGPAGDGGAAFSFYRTCRRGRLAPVARAEPRRLFRRNRSGYDLADGRAASRLEKARRPWLLVAGRRGDASFYSGPDARRSLGSDGVGRLSQCGDRGRTLAFPLPERV